VDVNVHPSKLEVRFEDEKNLYNFVLAVTRKSLASFDLVPSVKFEDLPYGFSEERKEKLKLTPLRQNERDDFSDRPYAARNENIKTNFSDKEIDLIFGNLDNVVEKNGSLINTKLPFDNDEDRDSQRTKTISASSEQSEESNFIIQLHNKYILTQIKSGLMIIDQHVAHERVLYEKAINLFEANFPFSQQLLFPKTIEVDPAVYKLLKEIYSYLLKIGFELKFFSKNTIIIEGVPQDVKSGSEEKILLELIQEYLNNISDKKVSDEKDNIAKSFSCKAAIKSGDKLTEREMRILIDQLFATSMPYVCPHGRPIVIKISLDEFDRRFGRT
jgi:DNA mismatch repair protein MutL